MTDSRQLEHTGLVGQTVEAVSGARVRLDGRWVLSFVSANYLGLARHPQVAQAMRRAVFDWGVSLGTPRSLAVDAMTARLEAQLARLVEQEQALVYPSTAHIALDVLPLLSGPRGALLMDGQAYTISREGASVAAQRGACIFTFPHNDSRALARLFESLATVKNKVVVCDGVYPAGGHPARLREIVRLARGAGAFVYVDDAHGLGVLGKKPTREMPYGHGGGGTPRYFGVPSGNLLHVASLSKAFGVPLAFVAGPARVIEEVRVHSSAHVHSSPPALPVVAAALAALSVHRIAGEGLRRTLVNRVRLFRNSLENAGLVLPDNHLFPLQTIPFASLQAAERAGRIMRQKGIWALVQAHPPDHLSGGVLRFVLTARHTPADIAEAVDIIGESIGAYAFDYGDCALVGAP